MVLDLGVQPAYRHGVYPDENGRFGAFGGRYVPEGLMPALLDLERAYRRARADPAFDEHLTTLLRDRVGRPTRLHEAPRFAATLGVPGLKVYLKREDMAYTGSHKINNALGQGRGGPPPRKTQVGAGKGAGPPPGGRPPPGGGGRGPDPTPALGRVVSAHLIALGGNYVGSLPRRLRRGARAV
ncbi:hypothetical protein [Nocardia cyriacigeorgica]|uniref:hypothetical protein n=1 Tax=Nocardia cyriacigeorgica TaxID=135487 RepID=UPI002455BAF8|nr:hypothetical protein [Nocardia cyriacigeorgica]